MKRTILASMAFVTLIAFVAPSIVFADDDEPAPTPTEPSPPPDDPPPSPPPPDDPPPSLAPGN